MRDRATASVRRAGAGYWSPEDFAKQMLRGDKDGKLTREEVVGLAVGWRGEKAGCKVAEAGVPAVRGSAANPGVRPSQVGPEIGYLIYNFRW